VRPSEVVLRRLLLIAFRIVTILAILADLVNLQKVAAPLALDANSHK
jgi:hypothetical protein